MANGKMTFWNEMKWHVIMVFLHHLGSPARGTILVNRCFPCTHHVHKQCNNKFSNHRLHGHQRKLKITVLIIVHAKLLSTNSAYSSEVADNIVKQQC